MWNCIFGSIGATSLNWSYRYFINVEGISENDWVDAMPLALPLAVSALYCALLASKKSLAFVLPEPALAAAKTWYNVSQVLFNSALAIQFVRFIQENDQAWVGDRDAIWSPQLGALLWLYYLNKIVDMTDTFFLIANGKRLSLLHTLHHLGQIWFSHLTLVTFPKGDIWFPAALNSVVHAFMYLWYLKPSRLLKPLVTTLQMSQLSLLAVHNVYVGFVAKTVPTFLSAVSMSWMVLLLLLFAGFSMKAYGKRSIVSDDIPVKPLSAQEAVAKLGGKHQTWGSKFLCIDTHTADLMWVNDTQAFQNLCHALESRGMIFLGEGYAKRGWTTTPHVPCDDALYEISKRIYGNLRAFRNRIPFITGIKWWLQGRNRGVKPSRAVRDRAASDHYSLSSTVLWDSILDPETKTYTCGIFNDDSLDLGKAQMAKVDYYIDQVMGLKDMSEEKRRNYSVLDVGSGWGSVVNRLSTKYPSVKVTALTHSPVQAKEYNPAVNVVVADMLDWKYPEQTFDCVTMIEVEHVGRNNYPILMKKIRKALKPNGMFVMQSLNTPTTQPSFLDEFIDTYIFPGGYLPSVNLLSEAAEKSGLKLVSTQEWDTQHYEITFELWRRRFASRYNEIAQAIGEEAARAFRIYLAFTQFTLEAQGFAPHTMIFRRRRDPTGVHVPHVPPVGVSDEKLSGWLSSRKKVVV